MLLLHTVVFYIIKIACEEFAQSQKLLNFHEYAHKCLQINLLKNVTNPSPHFQPTLLRGLKKALTIIMALLCAMTWKPRNSPPQFTTIAIKYCKQSGF